MKLLICKELRSVVYWVLTQQAYISLRGTADEHGSHFHRYICKLDIMKLPILCKTKENPEQFTCWNTCLLCLWVNHRPDFDQCWLLML